MTLKGNGEALKGNTYALNKYNNKGMLKGSGKAFNCNKEILKCYNDA